MSRTVIRTAGSIGNLGPGFDTLGLAVSLYLRVSVRRRIADGQGRLVTRYARPRPASEDGIVRAFQFEPFRSTRPASLEVDVESEIPERAGLGSSAAATLAGLKLRTLCDGPRSNDEILRAACHIERHPDNAVASLFGGLTSSTVGHDGGVTVARWKWPASWKLVLATPHIELATALSRSVLPPAIPLADVVFDLQRLALLLHAVNARDGSKLAAALRDRVHQPYREPLVPVLRRALEWRHPDVLGVCLSGAGPSVAVVVRRNPDGVARALARLYRLERVPCTLRIARVHQ
ncbi:MAG TPA: homoserine kinase [Vicinamibacterales bacterium]|jgi:homoserine kinase